MTGRRACPRALVRASNRTDGERRARPWMEHFQLALLLPLIIGMLAGDGLVHARESGCGQPSVEGCPLELGKPVEAVLADPTDVHLWRILVTADRGLRVRLTGLAVDYDLYVQGPDGQLIAASQNEGSVDELADVPVTSDGEYRLYIQANPSRATVSPRPYTLTAQWREQLIVRGHEGAVRATAYAPGGVILASAGEDGTARLWDAQDGTARSVLSGHEGAVTFVRFSPAEPILASASVDRTVRIWRTTDGSLLKVLGPHEDAVTRIAFSADGTLLSAGTADKAVSEWRVSDGSLQRRVGKRVLGVETTARSSDGRLSAEGSEVGTARVWHTHDGGGVQVLSGHLGAVRTVTFSPDGVFVATGGADRTVRVWRADDGTPLQTYFGHTRPVTMVRFAPDGRALASASEDGTVRVWPLRDE